MLQSSSLSIEKEPTAFSQNAKAKKLIEAQSDEQELPYIVSLFCGAGGLDLGFKKSGFKIALAIDISHAAITSHQYNFSRSHSIQADLIKLGPGGVLELVKNRIAKGSRIALIGGPPCQGFSRANTGSRADDPRNKLPALYLEIIEKLKRSYKIEFVVLENVLGIKDKKHSKIYLKLKSGLDALGFNVTESELCALDYGVPQNRRRIILCGLSKRAGYEFHAPRRRSGLKTVRCAIGDLSEPIFFNRSLAAEDIPHHPNHWTMRPKSARFSKKFVSTPNGRSFKKLDWDRPSPTIAFGHREIHVHPSGLRRLSIYEAMLLQGFPANFVLHGNLSQQAEQISNAVPPPLAHSLAMAIKRSLKRS